MKKCYFSDSETMIWNLVCYKKIIMMYQSKIHFRSDFKSSAQQSAWTVKSSACCVPSVSIDFSSPWHFTSIMEYCGCTRPYFDCIFLQFNPDQLWNIIFSWEPIACLQVFCVNRLCWSVRCPKLLNKHSVRAKTAMNIKAEGPTL